MTDWSERVVVITGAASGMGEATSHLLAKAGANVVLLDRDADKLPEVMNAVSSAGGRATGHVVDLTSEEQVAAVVAAILGEFGRIDAVDNNAAALELSSKDPDLLGLEAGVLEEIFRADVLPGFLMTKHVLPTMISQQCGSIINIASVAGMLGELWLTGYAMAKAAVIQMTRITAAQYSKQGIRCNAISPGYVTTQNNLVYAPKQLQGFYERNSLTQRVAAPLDVANAAMFLASDESMLITGQVLPVDGGLTAASPIAADHRESELWTT